MSAQAGNKRPLVGIVGGGQLARMLVQAGSRIGIACKVYDPAPDACAGQIAPLTCGAFADSNALLAFARDVDVLTFDFENIPAATLMALSQNVRIAPNPHALAMTQDRLSEKTAFTELGIPVAAYRAVQSEADMLSAVQELGANGILKTRTLGYDGKGQVRVRTSQEALTAFAQLGSTPCVFEQLVPFARELSIVAARAQNGNFVSYPLSENIHQDGILAVSIAPAKVSETLQAQALAIAQKVAERYQYVGTFALEFFQLEQTLVVNEMAPRVHNSGHWSIEGAECSQFENHLRAVCSLPLGSTSAREPSLMLNWIGEIPPIAPQLSIPGLALHNYGKGNRPGRKVGHSTLCAPTPAELLLRLRALQETCPSAPGALALARLLGSN
jgi:5-(carboxyamino)imidazole ribonucleotide synthase